MDRDGSEGAGGWRAGRIVLKIIIAGSRSLSPSVSEVDRFVRSSGFAPTLIVCGCADGMDQTGFAWARSEGIPVEFFPAWPRQRGWAHANRTLTETVHPLPKVSYYLAAGFKRNENMGRAADAAIVIYTGISRGSRNIMDVMIRLGKPSFTKEV